MEAVGVAASILGLVELGSKVSYKLFTFSKQVVHASADIGNLAQEVASVNVVLQQLAIQLKKDEEAPSKLCTKTLVDSARACVKKCKSIFDDIERMVDGGLESKKLSLKQKIKFSYNTPKVGSHLQKLDGLKLSLSFTLTIITYAESVRSREEGFVLSDQLQLLKSFYKDKVASEAENEKSHIMLATEPMASRPRTTQNPASDNDCEEQNTVLTTTDCEENSSITRDFTTPAVSRPFESVEMRMDRQRRRLTRKTQWRKLKERLTTESLKRPTTTLCNDKDMILYTSLVEDILGSIYSVDHAALDMRLRWDLHETVAQACLREMVSRLEPRGPYTAQEIPSCFRKGSTLMKIWLHNLPHIPVPRPRSYSTSSSSSRSDYGAPIRITKTQVLPTANYPYPGSQRHRSFVPPVINSINDREGEQPHSRSYSRYQLVGNNKRHRRRRDSSTSGSDTMRERTRARHRGRRDSSTSECALFDVNVIPEPDSEDIRALLESFTTLTSEEIQTSLRVETE